MDIFLDKLKKSKILTKEDIFLIKKNIHKQYPHLDNFSKNHILAKAIHTVLNRNLNGFTKNYKNEIKIYLIKDTFLKNKESICQYDVVRACALAEDTSLEFIYQITRWINNQTNEEIALTVIKNLIKDIDIEAEDPIYDEISLSSVFEENDSFSDTTVPEDNTQPIDNTNPMDDILSMDIETPPDYGDFLDNKQSLDIENISDSDDASKQIGEDLNTLEHYIALLKNKALKIISAASNKKTKKYILIYSLIICLLIIPISHITNYLYGKDDLIEVVSSIEYDEESLNFEKDDEIVISEEAILLTRHLPDYFKYKKINEKALKNYLSERNSLLSSDPYFSIMINCAEEFNINPILLFSIAGHEQSFVPRHHKKAKEIANNPYNVFQSWKNYNTNIEDSSKIACRTVINHLRNKPEKEDPFKWLNRRYAEDKNWWKGVKRIYNTLEKKVSVQ